MSTLFIIGNGFDLAHGLPTSYNHFKEYLRAEYEYNHNDTPLIWEPSSMAADGGEEYNLNRCAHIIDYLVSDVGEGLASIDLWSDFEKALGLLNFRNIEEEISDQIDDEGDVNPFQTGNLYDEAYKDLTNIMRFVQLLFQEWISTIEIPEHHYSLFNMDIYKDLKDLFAFVENPIFLTFNYTDTLEKLYEEDEVNHIHGNVNDPIVGHGDTKELDELLYHQDYHINRILEKLRKPCDSIIKENEMFLKSLEADITGIYTYGFSFSDVDAIYIKEIIKRIDTKNVVWYLQEYSSDKHKEYIDKLIKYGFEGSFDTF